MKCAVERIVLIVCLVFGIDSRFSYGEGRESLLFNPGPSYRAGKILVMKPTVPMAMPGWSGTSHWLGEAFELGESHLLKGGPRNCGPFSLAIDRFGRDMNFGANPQCLSESYYFDSRYWHKSTDYLKHFAVEYLGGGKGTPITYRYHNIGGLVGDCDKPKEFGIVFDGPKTIKTDFTLGRYKKLMAQFDIQLVGQSVTNLDGSGCTKREASGKAVGRKYEAPFDVVDEPWAYISVDIRVNYPDAGKCYSRGDMLSLHIYDATYLRRRYEPVIYKNWGNPVVYEPGLPCNVVPDKNQNIYGCAVALNGLGVLNQYGAIYLPEEFKYGKKIPTTYIDFKELIQRYLPPPSGCSIDDAKVAGFDVYSSLRNGDRMSWTVSNIDLYGELK